MDDPTTMTLDEIRDWFARRQGWEQKPHIGAFVDGLRWFRYGCIYVGGNDDHPIPATLDAIAGLMPSGWWWLKEAEDGEPIYWYGFHSQHSYICVKDTGNELLDRATLAYLAQIEQDKHKETKQ